MCLIAAVPANTFLTPEEIRQGFTRNDDGFGIMFGDGEGNLVIRKTTAKKGITEVLDIYEKIKTEYAEPLKTLPHAVHFRYKTHGNIDIINTHPCRVLRKDSHGVDLYMMHNGVISGHPYIPNIDSTKSDTWHYIKYILRPILKTNPALIHDERFQALVAMSLGTQNKLTFMDNSGKMVIINGHQGEKRSDGIWLSNSYALRNYANDTYSYKNDYNRHYSGPYSIVPPATAIAPITETKPDILTDKVFEGKLISENGMPNLMNEKYYKENGEFLTELWKKDAHLFFCSSGTVGSKSPAEKRSNDGSKQSDKEPTNGSTSTANSTDRELPGGKNSSQNTGEAKGPSNIIPFKSKSEDIHDVVAASAAKSIFGKSKYHLNPDSQIDMVELEGAGFIEPDILKRLDENQIQHLCKVNSKAITGWIIDQHVLLDHLSIGKLR